MNYDGKQTCDESFDPIDIGGFNIIRSAFSIALVIGNFSQIPSTHMAHFINIDASSLPVSV